MTRTSGHNSAESRDCMWAPHIASGRAALWQAINHLQPCLRLEVDAGTPNHRPADRLCAHSRLPARKVSLKRTT